MALAEAREHGRPKPFLSRCFSLNVGKYRKDIPDPLTEHVGPKEEVLIVIPTQFSNGFCIPTPRDLREFASYQREIRN